jgi:cysteine-rich repeat protein
MRIPTRPTLVGLLLALILSVGIFVAHPTFAQEVDLESFAEQAGFSTSASITVIIARLIRTVISFIGVIAVAYMVYGGFLWMTSAGEATRLKKAKDVLTNALIGLVIVFLSFAIVSFVLRALVGDGDSSGIFGSGSGSGTYSDSSGSSVFALSSVNTECAEALQNLQLQFVFTKKVDSSTIEEGIVIADAGGTAVAGTFSTSGRTVTFTPSTTCASPYETEYCFEAGASYTIEVDSSVIESSSGSSLTCTTTYPCSYSFTAGTGIDIDDPTVKMDAPEDGESLYAGSIEQLQALTSDDSGVSTVDFYLIDDDEVLYSSGVEYSTAGALVGGEVENAFFTDDAEEWATSGYTTNEEYDIWAKGSDCAGNTDTTSRVTIVLRAANCFNEEIDTDLGEEELNCGGDSSSAYYCGACDGDECTEDVQCSSGQCVDGSCVTTPKIESVTAGDGAPGNLITISGEGFGDEEGVVTFLGTESGDQVQATAYECNDEVAWSDDEIIVQVPGSAVDGAISITTSDDEIERTDDDYGPSIADFDVNAIKRPGICQLSPSTNESGKSIDVFGNGFGDTPGTSTFYFTNYEASSYVSWSDALLDVVVPRVNSGAYRGQVFTGDYVCIDSDGVSSGVTCGDDDDCDTDAGESCATSWCSESLDYCGDDDDCGDGGGSCESIRVGSNKVAFTVADVSSDETPIISSIDSGWKACSDNDAHCGDDDDCSDGATCEDADNWGPSGQYITIYGTGFGTSTGSINFENTSLGYTALGDTDFPDACGEDFWHDTYVTVKVPSTYQTETDDPIQAITHSLSLERSDGISSDETDFVVLNDVPGPSICDIDPSSAPAGVKVTIYGENFGSDQGEVVFYSLQSGDFSSWSTDEISSVVVPDDAATGPVYAIEAISGYTSNSITFTVGDCRADADLCEEGESCCDNGSCSTSCDTQVEVAAHYAFMISTGLTPNTPEVIVACTEDGVSPAPWEGWSDSEDICVNASVEAEFDMTMDQDTITTDTVVVRKCTALFTAAEEAAEQEVCAFSGEECSDDEDCDEAQDEQCLPPEEGECKNWEIEEGYFASKDETGFSWSPKAGSFATDTWYRVTLQGEDQIMSKAGGYLEEDFEWDFTTRSSTDLCDVGDVNVRPDEYTQTTQDYVDYTAQLTSKDDMCVALSCSGYTIGWDSVDDEVLIPVSEWEGICSNEVYAQEETVVDDPAIVTATVQDVEVEPSGDTALTINFLDPEIDDYFPQCSTACVNALPWAQFNTRMDGSTLGPATVELYLCENSLCETSALTAVSLDSVGYSGAACTDDDDSDQLVSLVFSTNLTANTWYRVVIDGDVSSCTGVALSDSGSNYGTDENRYFENDFSWTFKTKNDSVSCAVDSVTLDPDETTLKYIGQRAEFDATGKGAPDDCSVNGQTLQSSSYSWDAWSATDNPNTEDPSSGSSSAQDNIVAYMVLDGAIALTGEIPAYCTAACLNAGAPVTTAQGVCGNNSVEDSEECDDGLAEDGDGCSAACLNEGSSTTCGNGGPLDEFEDCDDGNTTGGDGCSSICLNEGSRSVDAVCGDGGEPDWAANTGGEDCDDGNTTAGDGCSRNCLLEGSQSEEDVFAICGNGTVCHSDADCASGETCNDFFQCVEPGEDCDPGSYNTDGDGCSSECVWEGTSLCASSTSSNCCGNSTVEQGEDCDGDEGCSSSCLWAGSSYSYDDPSFCGDTDVGTGEECDADASSSTATGDYGVAQIATGAPVEVDEETGYAVSTVSVTVDSDVTGEATVQLQCACTTDASCGVEGIGCGDKNCCYERPAIVSGKVYPSDNSGDLAAGGDGYCRNTAVWLDFTQGMDKTTFDLTEDDDNDGVDDTTDGDGIIQQDEFNANLYLDLVSADLDGDGDQDSVDEIADCPDDYTGGSDEETTAFRFWHWIKSFVLGIFGREANASTTFACHIPLKYELSENSDGTQRVALRYNQLLEENAIYRLVVIGDNTDDDTTTDGVLGESGATLCIGDTCDSETFIQTFEVGTEICDLDRVVVEDLGNVAATEYEDVSVQYFSATNEKHAFTATPQTYRQGSGYEEIAPLEDLYEWEWGWSSSVSASSTSSSNVVEPVDESPEDTSRDYTASGSTGRENVLATATITVDELFDPTTAATTTTSARTVTGTLEVTALVCENPWPALASKTLDFPYLEDDLPSNFSFYYCRDAGDVGTDDDLPALDDPINVSSLSSSGILQELIFKVEDTSDAIGVRVIPNASFCSSTTATSCSSDSDCPTGESCLGNGSYLTPSAWVEGQEFTGSFTETELDGYPAVSSASTLYAAAANVSGSTIYPNIYVVSYNENASDEAQEIFDQILENWRFNGNTDEVTDVNLCMDSTDNSYELYFEDESDTQGEYVECEWDGDCFETFGDDQIICDAQKGKLTRDMTRLLDVTTMSTTLDEYGEENAHCSVTKGQSCDDDDDCPGSEECVPGFPEVQSGTFVPALSNSIWGSWSASLGNELGTALPTDPVNEFYDCSETGYDSTSCWNGESGTFICPDNSHLYGYQSVGGEAYKLYSVLETDGGEYTWAYALDTNLSDEATVYVEYPASYAPSSVRGGFTATPMFCDGGTWGDSALCGDGTQGASEVCEIGDTTTGVACTVCVNLNDDTFHGVEGCEIDDDCGTDGTCATGTTTYACVINASDQCEWDTTNTSACSAYECGNGVVETGESCDDGSLNGTYGHCDDECGAGSAFYCGDGYLAGSEQCDCGKTLSTDAASWAVLNSCDVANGQYSSDIDVSCAYDCTQPGLACGDEVVNGIEECDGDYEEWEGALCSDGKTTCTSDADCDSGDTCGDTGYESAGTGTICIGGTREGFSCTSDASCLGGGTCSTNTYDLYRYRLCNARCAWPRSWKGPVGGDQQCGNGTVEGDEVCDDGNSSNNDACLNTCEENVCGDDYVEVGVESCDDGVENGTACTARYGDTCNYCNVSCQYKTKTGGYCGDGVVDTGEVCDGTYATKFTYFDDETGDTYGSCSAITNTTSDSDGVGYTCHWLGVCNGGSENGEYCTLDYASYVFLGTVVELTSSTTDTNSCGTDGECVPPVCADDCGSSCPTSYKTTGLLVQSETAGATATDSVSLYGYLNNEGESPDNGVLYIPACSVATGITADIDDSDVTSPTIHIIFVTDLTGSMNNPVSGSTAGSCSTTTTTSCDANADCPRGETCEPEIGNRKIDLAIDATKEAIGDLFDAYGSSIDIGLYSYTTAYRKNNFCNGNSARTDGVNADFGLSPYTSESSMLTMLEDYASCVDFNSGSTPTYNAMERATNVLSSSSADVKIVVMLTDGDFDWNDTFEESSGDEDHEEECIVAGQKGNDDVVSTYTYSKTLDNGITFTGKSACAADMYDDFIDSSDIQYYTAAITDSPKYQGLTEHISSNDCEWESKSAATDPDDCSGNYAYVATTSDGIEEMFDSIIDAILGTNISLTATASDGSTTTTTGDVQPGSDVVLPFPESFVCQSSEQTVPLRHEFNGSGSMLFSDFTMTYCPY